jgi:transcriptional regulator with XRE-family HTH domain
VALFFDQQWFLRRLESFGLSKADLARAAGLTRDELDAVWKDQREVSSAEVASMAALLGVELTEMASRCGVSTPTPTSETAYGAAIATLTKRVEALELALATLLAAHNNRL